MTVVGPHRERLLTTVAEELQLPDERHRTALLASELPYLKDVVRAHADAVGLGLTTAAIDDGHDLARLRAAARLRVGSSPRHASYTDAAGVPQSRQRNSRRSAVPRTWASWPVVIGRPHFPQVTSWFRTTRAQAGSPPSRKARVMHASTPSSTAARTPRMSWNTRRTSSAEPCSPRRSPRWPQCHS